mmetsp:Transcript_8217/g.22306  ORF Transcript_8217/g.22306 Transcript_8217/m.22306 type:complete len:93 (+) Transcript_8217:1165-1443(+)
MPIAEDAPSCGEMIPRRPSFLMCWRGQGATTTSCTPFSRSFHTSGANKVARDTLTIRASNESTPQYIVQYIVQYMDMNLHSRTCIAMHTSIT